MKRILTMLIIIAMFPAAAFSELPDISGLSFDELEILRRRIVYQMWESDEWQFVEVPPGVYKIGEDIPEGHWTIVPVDGTLTNYVYTDRLDEYGKSVGYGWKGYLVTVSTRKNKDGSWKDPEYSHETDIDAKADMFLIVENTSHVMPYTGKTDLNFKR